MDYAALFSYSQNSCLTTLTIMFRNFTRLSSPKNSPIPLNFNMTALRGKLFSDCGGLQFGVGGMTTTSACDGSGLIILAGGEQRLTITRLRATHQQVRSPAP